MPQLTSMPSHPSEVLFLESPVPTMMLGRDGTIQDINPAARRLLAASRERILGRPILGFVEEADRNRIRDFFLRVLKGQTREWTTRLRRGDGSLRGQWMKALSSPEGASWDGALVFCRDLADSPVGSPDRDQLGSLLENLPGQFTMVVDPKGRIRYSSGLARTHFLPDAEALGKSYAGLFGGGWSDLAVQEMSKAVSEKGGWSDTQWHTRIDGSPLPVRVFASPYLDPMDGRHLGVLLVGRDISSELSWRERAGQAEHLAVVGEIAALAAEELENAWSVMSDVGAASQAYGDALVRAQAITTALGELSAIPVETDEVDVSLVVSDTVERWRARSPEIGSGIVMREPTTDVRSRVRGSGEALARAVDELVSNAMEASESIAGSPPLEVYIQAVGEQVTVRVRNAISPEGQDDLHRAFEPFFTTRSGRVGLGLSFVRSVAVSHGGRTWSERDDGGNVVFALQLPHLSSGSGGKFRPAPISVSRDRTVLVVDDEESVRIALRRFLGKVGFEVREAWSGRSALAQITGGHPPEILLTDIQMSDGAGDWLLDQLSRDFPDLLRKTLIITGAPDAPAVLSLAQRTGCTVVPKPLDLSALLEMVDELAVRE